MIICLALFFIMTPIFGNGIIRPIVFISRDSASKPPDSGKNDNDVDILPAPAVNLPL